MTKTMDCFLKNFLFLSCAFFLFACSSDDTTSMDEMESVDTRAPNIQIVNLPNVLEIKTDVQITIVDDSDIMNSTVMINGEEIVNSSEKKITITLNPFDYPIGANILKIVATDVNGNEAEEEIPLEMKRLLLRVPASHLEERDFSISDNYVLINSLDGVLLEYEKMEFGIGVSFYGEEMTKEQNIIVTILSKQRNDISSNAKTVRISSYYDVALGTILLDDSEIRALSSYAPLVLFSNDVNLEIVDVDNVSINGTGYFSNTISPNTYNLKYTNTKNTDFFFTSSYSFTTPENDFKYLIIDDPSQMNYSINDFSTVTDYQGLELPESLVQENNGNRYNYRLQAYRNETDYQNNIKHNLIGFSISGATENPFKNGVNTPLIPELPIYEITIGGTVREDYEIEMTRRGFDFKDIPEINTFLEGDRLISSGAYDRMQFVLRFFDFNETDFLGLDWFLVSAPNNNIEVPFFNFQFPDEILAIFEEGGFSVDARNNNKISISASLIQKEELKDNTTFILRNTTFLREGNGSRFMLTHSFPRN